MARPLISKEECLSFLLSYLVVERGIKISLDQMSLFRLLNLAAEAEAKLTSTEGQIRHEVIETMANHFIEEL